MNKKEKEIEEPNLTVEYEITVRDKHGKVTEHRKEQSNSLIKNFLLLINAAFDVGASVIVDTAGVNRSASAKGLYSRCGGYPNSWSSAAYGVTVCAGPGGWHPDAATADDTYGIVVGTSDTAVTVDDYNLGAKIEHGSGVPGKMYHYSVNLYDPTVDGAIVKQKFDRSFLNNSGDAITVKEIGLILKTNRDNYLVMIIRDVITPIPVPNGSVITTTYFIRTSG